jgi:hypothetical protein
MMVSAVMLAKDEERKMVGNFTFQAPSNILFEPGACP